MNVTFLFFHRFSFQPVQNYIPSSRLLDLFPPLPPYNYPPGSRSKRTNERTIQDTRNFIVLTGRGEHGGELSPLETASFQPITINASGVSSSAFVYIEFHFFPSLFSVFPKRRGKKKNLPSSFEHPVRPFRRITLLITRDKFKRFSSFFEIGVTSLI